MNESVLSWACRSLAWLDFSGASSYLIQIVQSAPGSELAGHALIAIGELHSKDAMPLIFNLVQSDMAELSKNNHWLTYAFRNIAEPQDYIALSHILQQGNNSNTSHLSAVILAESGNRKWDQLIFSYVLDLNVPAKQRNRVFQEWSNALISPKASQAGIQVINTVDTVTVSPEISEHLHTLFARNDELSSLALLLLINTSPNLERVSEENFTMFGGLVADFSLRQTILFKPQKWIELGKLIREWLHHHLEHDNLTPERTGNWFELLKMIADHSTIDVLNRNRQRYNTLFGKQRVDALENRIRKGRNHPFEDL